MKYIGVEDIWVETVTDYWIASLAFKRNDVEVSDVVRDALEEMEWDVWRGMRGLKSFIGDEVRGNEV